MGVLNESSARNHQYDVAILGSGQAGSMLGAVLARNGVDVLLIDAATHPRFAVGESTIPYTSALTNLIAERYKVPEIAPLASFKGVKEHVSSNCGRKQNFGFVYHREGKPQNPGEINQLIIPAAVRTETHLFRQDTDAYLFHLAIKYGAEPRMGTRIEDIEIDPDSGAVLRAAGGEEFRASYVVDAGGYRSPLAEKFQLREEPTRALHHSRTMFTHMVGVTPYDDAPSAKGHEQPNPWHHGTLHHIFDGGWLWVIPFDNHEDSHNALCSVGLTLDPRVYPKPELTAQQEFDDFLRRFPEIAHQFSSAKAARPWVSTGRLQYSSKRCVGDRFCLTSHAAGFIDALYSRGLTNTLEVVNALAWRLIEASRDGDWSTERFEYVDALQQGLFDVHDDLVYSSFVGFKDYSLWNAIFRVWKTGTVLGSLTVQSGLRAFLQSGEDQVFRDMEQWEFPGSPFPVSKEFNQLGPYARDLCQRVEAGKLSPRDAATRLFAHLRDADYLAPAFGFAKPEQRWFEATPPIMQEAIKWSNTEAPEHIGDMFRRAFGDLA